nr:MAG TPA: hypothetical protein [Caudoviricetes sp.]
MVLATACTQLNCSTDWENRQELRGENSRKKENGTSNGESSHRKNWF